MFGAFPLAPGPRVRVFTNFTDTFAGPSPERQRLPLTFLVLSRASWVWTRV